MFRRHSSMIASQEMEAILRQQIPAINEDGRAGGVAYDSSDDDDDHTDEDEHDEHHDYVAQSIELGAAPAGGGGGAPVLLGPSVSSSRLALADGGAAARDADSPTAAAALAQGAMPETRARRSTRQSRQFSGVVETTTVEDETSPCFGTYNEARWWSFLCHPRWFSLLCCAYIFVQSFVVLGLFPATLSSVRQRYDFKSSTMGLIAAFYDAGVVLFAGHVSFYGGKGNTPRWLGTGFLVLCAGSILYASPEFFASLYDPSITQADTCSSGNLIDPSCRGESSGWLAMFLIAQLVIAYGATPLFSLTPPYFDSIVDKPKLPMYLSVFYATGAVGPGFGFLVASLSLVTWVNGDDDKPASLDEEDDEWVGMWWVGFVVIGVAGMFAAVLFYFYPRFLPNTRRVRRLNKLQTKLITRRRSSQLDLESSSVKQTLRALSTNKTFIFNALGQATEGFMIAGFAAFLPAAVESIFGLTSSEASFSVGLVTIPGAAGGIFLGGWAMRKIQATPVENAKYVWVAALVSLFTFFGFFIGCDTIRLAGVTAPYPATGQDLSYMDTCNSGCLCDQDAYRPVCDVGSQVNFFSACHAGCTVGQVNSNGIFQNCSCISTVGGQVELGKCSTGCDSLPIFLFIMFITMLTTFFNNAPGITAVLGSMEYRHRSLGMGVVSIISRVLGTIPGPIVLGAAIDSTCVLYERSCGGTEESNVCLEYDNEDLRRIFVLFGVIPKFLSFVFFFLSWWFLRPLTEQFNRTRSTRDLNALAKQPVELAPKPKDQSSDEDNAAAAASSAAAPTQE